MPSIYQLKSRFQGLLRPLVESLARKGVTANQVTIGACLLSFAVGGFVHWTQSALALLLMPVALFARMALNAIDGMLAREHGQKSNLGALLNELGDVISDAAIYLPFMVAPGLAGMALVWVVVLAGASEMAGVLGQTIGASRRYDGPMGKSDRAFVFGVLALPAAAGLLPRWLGQPALWVVLALLALTIVNRMRGALKEIGVIP